MFEITPQEVERFLGRLDHLYNEMTNLENHHLFTKVIGIDLHKSGNLTEEEVARVVSLEADTDSEEKKHCFLLVMRRLSEVATGDPEQMSGSAEELRRQIQESSQKS